MMKKILISTCLFTMVLFSRFTSTAEADTPLSATMTPEAFLIGYATEYHVSPELLLKVASCESGVTLNTKALGDHGKAKGILQFHDPTFLHYAKQLDIEHPDIWNVEQQAKVGAYMFSIGQKNQWTCTKMVS